MVAILDYQAGNDRPIVARTATGSITRSFSLPIELSGLTLSINGAACGLKSVSRHRIEFVVPPAIASSASGTFYPIVITNNGTKLKSTVLIVPAQPDIFTKNQEVAAFGRANLFNVTNRVRTTEPFVIKTIKVKGNMLVPSVIRVYLTGVANVSSGAITVRIGASTISGTAIKTSPSIIEPGVYIFDFELPAALLGGGDQPIIVTVTAGGVAFSSRLDDTSSSVRIL